MVACVSEPMRRLTVQLDCSMYLTDQTAIKMNARQLYNTAFVPKS